MSVPPDHGPRISQGEHDQRIEKLRRSLPDRASAAERERADREEFDVRIDRHLGVDFPAARREELWQAHQRIEAQRRRFSLRALWRKITHHSQLPGPPDNEAANLPDAVTRAYAKVLDPDELAAFRSCELEETLPTDTSND